MAGPLRLCAFALNSHAFSRVPLEAGLNAEQSKTQRPRPYAHLTHLIQRPFLFHSLQRTTREFQRISVVYVLS